MADTSIHRRVAVAGVAGVVLALSACSGAEEPEPGADTEQVTATAPHTPESAPTTGEAAVAMTEAPERTTSAPTAEAAAPTTDADPTDEATSAAPTTAEASETTPTEAGGDVIVVSEGTVFTTPAQAAFCSLSAPRNGMAAAITCEVMQSSVPAEDPLQGICSSDGYGWYVNFFADVGHGGFFCNHHEGIVHSSGVDLANEPWVDPTQVALLEGGTRVGVLGYGRVLQAGSLACSVQPDGLTCSSAETGRGFTLNTASYVSW